MAIIRNHSSAFQQVGLDEAYIDVSEICSNFNQVHDLAKSIQIDIFQKVGITLSIGCATTKSIAKIASDYNKPNGITIVKPESMNDFLKDLDITRIPGIGKKSKVYYNKKGINVIGDIINTPLYVMVEKFGKSGEWVWKIANGLDKREVKEFHEDRKSISKERTFYEDTDDLKEILSKLEDINERIHNIINKHNIYYRTITLKVRLEGFLTYTRSRSVSYPIQDKNKVLKVVIDLMQKFFKIKKKVRLVGIKLSNLSKDFNVLQTNILNYVKV